MKLTLKISAANPRLEKIRFEPMLVELFDAYMAYYKTQLAATITTEQVITEIITAFIKSDRGFMHWYRDRITKVEKIIE